MKYFTKADLWNKSLAASYYDLVDCPLEWQKRGLQQTSTGYGAKLTSRYKIHFEGKLRRIYHTCYGNASSAWFIFDGGRIYIH